MRDWIDLEPEDFTPNGRPTPGQEPLFLAPAKTTASAGLRPDPCGTPDLFDEDGDK